MTCTPERLEKSSCDSRKQQQLFHWFSLGSPRYGWQECDQWDHLEDAWVARRAASYLRRRGARSALLAFHWAVCLSSSGRKSHPGRWTHWNHWTLEAGHRSWTVNQHSSHIFAKIRCYAFLSRVWLSRPKPASLSRVWNSTKQWYHSTWPLWSLDCFHTWSCLISELTRSDWKRLPSFSRSCHIRQCGYCSSCL